MSAAQPFFNYYGSKYRIATRYGAPTYGTIVEPFAGSASYSLWYPACDVHLYDLDPVIVGVWDYLIHASRAEIERLPDAVRHVDELDAPQEAKWLVGFWLNKGGTSPKLQASTWMNDPVSTFWGRTVKNRILRQVDQIRHWTVELLDYRDVPNREATWFVDPPYSGEAGRIYRFDAIDYDHLGGWCRERLGERIVCEHVGADWLPFEPFALSRAMEGKKGKKRSPEAVWFDPARTLF